MNSKIGPHRKDSQDIRQPSSANVKRLRGWGAATECLRVLWGPIRWVSMFQWLHIYLPNSTFHFGNRNYCPLSLLSSLTTILLFLPSLLSPLSQLLLRLPSVTAVTTVSSLASITKSLLSFPSSLLTQISLPSLVSRHAAVSSMPSQGAVARTVVYTVAFFYFRNTVVWQSLYTPVYRVNVAIMEQQTIIDAW